MKPGMDASTARRHDVAIVGYGPTGATLAGLLGRLGLRVAVFEKSPEVYAQPRAVGFDHDAMRLFQRIGVADALAPHIAPFRDAQYFGVGGRLIQQVRHMPPPYPLTWAPNYTCDQPGLEAVLREAVAALGCVQVSLGRELLQAVETGTAVRLEVRDAAGRMEDHEASYLVACDGASSPVRRSLGIGLESMQYDEPWIVVDVKVREEFLDRLPPTNVQYCQPERPSTFITCPGNHRRWEFMLLDGEPSEGAVSEARLWKLLARWLEPGQAQIWRAAAYRFHALVAHDWRRGRILLAGDAAHQTPPFLGQGMCQGLRDAGNLAWKLARVLRGTAAEALLDTYTEERRPHVVETTRLAKEFGRIISERDPQAARLRDERMLAANHGAPRQLVRQELIPGLTAGLVSRVAPLAGKVFPQPLVGPADGAPMLLDDLAGPCFRLVLHQSRAGRDLDALAGAALACGLRVQVLCEPGCVPALPAYATAFVERDGLLGRWFSAAGAVAALVRPDHYIFGACGDLAGATALLEEFAASGAMVRSGAAT